VARHLHVVGLPSGVPWCLRGWRTNCCLDRTLFEAEPGNDNVVQFSYGGTVYSTEAVGTHVWMLEILMLAIHWENKVVGPTLMLRDSQVAGT